MKRSRGFFEKFSIKFGDLFGSPASFFFFATLILIWGASGSFFHYSDTWQLIVNTPTTIVELFAAITIQYVGNRIQRKQEEHELRMLQMLSHVEKLVEQIDNVVEAADPPPYMHL